MSNIPRQAIVSIAAIVGAQLTNLVLSPPQAGQSSSCLQWASEAVDTAYRAIQPTAPESFGYYDVRQKRDVEINGDARPSSAAMAPALPTRSAAPAPAAPAYDPTESSLTPAADRAIDQQIAASRGQSLTQYYQSLQGGN